MNTNYEEQAIDFLTSTNTTFTATFLRHGPYFDETVSRDIYEIVLSRNGRIWKFTFGNSIVASKKWTIFDPKGNTFTNDDNVARKAKLYGRPSGVHTERNKDFEAPTPYSVLSTITKNDPGSFDDFCSDFGVDSDSKKAEILYTGVLQEWRELQRLFNDAEIEQLNEIN